MTWFTTIAMLIYIIGFLFLIMETQSGNKKASESKKFN